MELRDYQLAIAADAKKRLDEYQIAYLSMEVRTGKTITALHAARIYGAKHVLFFTKKKAIASIENDYQALNPRYLLTVTNYDQLHNITIKGFDLVILDEAHCLGQFPKPAVRTKLLKKLCRGLPIIYLSGTPTPESYSQIYHQLWVSSYSPFAEHANFYKWAAAGYVEKKVRYLRNIQVNDWSCGIQSKIDADTRHLFISYTQQEAGFQQEVKEHIIEVEMKHAVYKLADALIRNRIYISPKSGAEILGDTAVKLQQKLHQIYSGTVLDEQGTGFIIDDTKAVYILDKFYANKQKIAIFYKFQAEYRMLQQVFGKLLTQSPEEFNQQSNLVFCSQIQSGREGINLSTADVLVMLNIDFSSVSYQQARARMQSKERSKEALLYWIFVKGGIEEKIYQRVINKQDYTLSYFRKDYGIKPEKVTR